MNVLLGTVCRSPSISVLGGKCDFHHAHIPVACIFHFSIVYVLPRALYISIMISFPVQSEGSLILFYIFKCRKLVLIKSRCRHNSLWEGVAFSKYGELIIHLKGHQNIGMAWGLLVCLEGCSHVLRVIGMSGGSSLHWEGHQYV